ncbi:MAG: beta-ketoacyl-[acyl-carrier-protein] synthase family protein [Candidatus Omnitrophota bacterium]|jgi:3-oxoacyl-[acyl-carrier-protein] synthase II
MGKRIVITGIGIVSPIGIGKEEFWKNLFAGQSGFRDITFFDTKDLKVKIAGEVTDFNAKDILGKKGLVDLDRATILLMLSTKFALEDANLEMNEENACKTGISVGTTFGSLNSVFVFDETSLVEGPKFVNPSQFPNTVINSPASRVAIRFGVKGFNSTLSSGFCAALDAFDYAMHSMNFNRADRIIVGAVEEMCIQTFLGFYKLGYLSGFNNNAGPQSCPFDRRRDGIIFSEASTAVTLEDLPSALNRKATIYGEILAVASNFDPYRLHKHNPRGTGIVKVMQAALEKANLRPQDIDCIFANANSTQDADYIETKCIKEVFGVFAKKIPVTAIKSMVGETFSASGGVAVIAALGSMNRNRIPPTMNYKEKDPSCDLDYVPCKVRKQKVNKVMINSFGPNGANTVLILGKIN